MIQLTITSTITEKYLFCKWGEIFALNNKAEEQYGEHCVNDSHYFPGLLPPTSFLSSWKNVVIS